MRRRSFNGWKMFGQFSFQTGSNPTPGVEQSRWKHNTRRGALTLRFKNEQFTAIAVVEQIWNTEDLANADFGEDTTIASAAVNFLTVPSVRLFLMGQYLKNVYNAPGTPVHNAAKLLGAGLNTATNPTGIEGRGFDGFNVGVNAQIKLWGGDLYLTTGYNDWEYKGDVVEGQETGLKHYLVGAAYESSEQASAYLRLCQLDARHQAFRHGKLLGFFRSELVAGDGRSDVLLLTQASPSHVRPSAHNRVRAALTYPLHASKASIKRSESQ